MRTLGELTVPLLLASVMLASALRGVDLYEAMRDGARKGLRLCAEILPALVVLLAVVGLLRASGLPERLNRLLGPPLRALSIPEETGLLLLFRPLSGGAAMAVASDLITQYGPDSLIGRTAAVMMGSSETTFYVAAVYLGGAGVKDSRWAIPAALCADLTCFLSSAWLCRLLWG